MAQTFSQIWIHLVWSTKNREPWLIKSKRRIIFEHIRQQAIDKGYYIDVINGLEDHVHCLLSLQPKFALSRVVNDIKGESSRWINDNTLLEVSFEWQDGYGAFSISAQNVSMVRNYILNQELHHKAMSFEDEVKKMKFNAFIK